MEKELLAILSSNKLRITSPRRAVFSALASANKPLSVQEAIALSPAIDRVSVYRTLDLFQALRIVEIVTLGWKKRYELASPFKSHHHHLHCERCGETIKVSSEKLEQFMHSLAAEQGFHSTSHSLEISGLCKTCFAANELPRKNDHAG